MIPDDNKIWDIVYRKVPKTAHVKKLKDYNFL